MTKRRSVMHVVHGLGSGVESVIADYVAATPEYDHRAAYSADLSCHDQSWASGLLGGVDLLDHRLRAFTRQLRTVVREQRPSIVHAHSSVGGAVARAALGGTEVLYTPHCYSFLRQDVSGVGRAAFRAIESTLSLRGGSVAACSPYELSLSHRLGLRRRRLCYIPNIAPAATPAERDRAAERRGVLTSRDSPVPQVVTAGRIAPQKDPGFVSRVARLARERGVEAHFGWIGDGDADLRADLESAGVTVTGWVSRKDARARLGAADIYLHSSLWEGAPMAVLESAALGVPVITRGTRDLDGWGLVPSAPDPAGVVDLLAEPAAWTAAALGAVAEVSRNHTAGDQRRSLLDLYDSISGRT